MSAVSANSLLTFKAMDVDRSSGISLAEFGQGRALASSALRQAIGNSDIKTVFNQFDTDKSSSLSSAELAVGLQQVAADSANALLEAQNHMSLSATLAVSLASQLYGTLGTASGASYNLTERILGAYYAV